MPRYIKQKDDFSCGPIALLNVRLWAGQSVSYKQNYKECRVICKCSEEGTQRSHFQRALNHFAPNSYDVYTNSYLNIRDLANHIKADGIAVLMHYFPNAWYSHFCLVTGRQGDDWVVINDDVDHFRKVISHLEMKKYMKRQFIDGVWFPKLWFINQI